MDTNAPIWKDMKKLIQKYSKTMEADEVMAVFATAAGSVFAASGLDEDDEREMAMLIIQPFYEGIELTKAVLEKPSDAPSCH